MSDDYPTTCPFCKFHHDAMSSVQGDGVPTDGDLTLCFNCGSICVIDNGADGGLRRPTKKEQRGFKQDAMVIKLIEAWKAILKIR